MLNHRKRQIYVFRGAVATWRTRPSALTQTESAPGGAAAQSPRTQQRRRRRQQTTGALWRSGGSFRRSPHGARGRANSAAHAREITESTWHAALVLTPPSWKRPLVADTPVIDRHG